MSTTAVVLWALMSTGWAPKTTFNSHAECNAAIVRIVAKVHAQGFHEVRPEHFLCLPKNTKEI